MRINILVRELNKRRIVTIHAATFQCRRRAATLLLEPPAGSGVEATFCVSEVLKTAACR